jgi:hypothetical protein
MILVCMIWLENGRMGCRCLQTIIDNESNDFNYFRGNRTKNKIGADGK